MRWQMIKAVCGERIMTRIFFFYVSCLAVSDWFCSRKKIAHLRGLEFGKVRGQPRRLRSMLIRKKERVGSLNRLSKYKFVGDAERDLDREKYRKVFRKTADTHCAANQQSYHIRRHNRNQPRGNYTNCMLERSTNWRSRYKDKAISF